MRAEELSEAINLYNKYRDKYYEMRDLSNNHEYGILYLYLCTTFLKDLNHVESSRDYYAKKIREHYKKYPKGTLREKYIKL